MFSARLPFSLTVNRLTQLLAALRADRAEILDLSETNPTRVGLAYPPALLAPLADPGSLAYAPAPRGLASAREAVAIDYLRHGLEVDPARIFLTARTSEAYSLLFKLLCDPGDEVLVPRPSYPLFEHLTLLDAVRAVPYALEYHGVWSLNVESLREAITPRTRAILIVSPNNPTGSLLDRRELEAIVGLCASHDLALIGDEVFADYLFEEADPSRVSVLAQDQVLTFALGGLSKSAGLPQLKLGWMAMTGPAARCEEASERLDLICDTYLSVATPVQRAAAMLLEQGAIVRGRIQARLESNRRALQRALTHAPGCSLLHLEAGWSAVVRVPAIQGEEALVLDLLAQDRVLVMPGYFYDFPREAYVVVSLLPDPDVFAAGVDRLLARAQAALSSF